MARGTTCWGGARFSCCVLLCILNESASCWYAMMDLTNDEDSSSDDEPAPPLSQRAKAHADVVVLSDSDDDEQPAPTLACSSDFEASLALARRLQEEDDAAMARLMTSTDSPSTSDGKRARPSSTSGGNKRTKPSAKSETGAVPGQTSHAPASSVYLHDLDQCLAVALATRAADGEHLLASDEASPPMGASPRSLLERLSSAPDVQRLVISRLLRVRERWNLVAGKQPKLIDYVPERTAAGLLQVLRGLESAGLVQLHTLVAGASRERTCELLRRCTAPSLKAAWEACHAALPKSAAKFKLLPHEKGSTKAAYLARLSRLEAEHPTVALEEVLGVALAATCGAVEKGDGDAEEEVGGDAAGDGDDDDDGDGGGGGGDDDGDGGESGTATKTFVRVDPALDRLLMRALRLAERAACPLLDRPPESRLLVEVLRHMRRPAATASIVPTTPLFASREHFEWWERATELHVAVGEASACGGELFRTEDRQEACKRYEACETSAAITELRTALGMGSPRTAVETELSVTLRPMDASASALEAAQIAATKAAAVLGNEAHDILRAYLTTDAARYTARLPTWLQCFDVASLLGRAALVGVGIAEKERHYEAAVERLRGARTREPERARRPVGLCSHPYVRSRFDPPMAL